MKFADIDAREILEAVSIRFEDEQRAMIARYTPATAEQEWREEAAGVTSAKLDAGLERFAAGPDTAVVREDARNGYVVQGGSYTLDLTNAERGSLAAYLRGVPRSSQKFAHARMGPVLRQATLRLDMPVRPFFELTDELRDELGEIVKAVILSGGSP